MTTYTVLAPMGITISSGKVKLNADQARCRKHAVSPVKDAPGVYAVNTPVMFKRGESFGYDGEIGKTMATALIDQASGETVADARRAAEEKEKKRKAAQNEEKPKSK